MKIIFAYLDPNTFYKVIIGGDTITKIINARDHLSRYDYDGELFVPIGVWNVAAKKTENGRIVVSKWDAEITAPAIKCLYWEEENLLDYGDDLFKLNSIHLTKRFLIMIEDAKKYLNSDEIELIRAWEALK